MPDKKYNELSKRLHSKNKDKSGGNFRSYDRIRQDRQDMKGQAPAQKERSGAEKSRRGKSSSIGSSLKRLFIIAAPFIAVIFLVILAVYALTNKNSTEVNVNGETVGHVKTTKLTEDEFLTTLTTIISQIEETKIQITDEISLSLVHGKKKLLKEEDQIINLMADLVNYKVQAAVISVDGQEIGTAKSKEEAERIFDAIKEPYLTSEYMTAEFVQDVTATEKYVEKDEIDSSDTIRADLVKSVNSSIEYIVVEGDSLSKIAVLNGISVSDIKEMNPDIEVEKTLKIGTKLRLDSTAPFVSVMTTENIVEIVDIKMETDEQPDSSLPKGQKKILLPGKPGKKEVSTQIIRVNGLVTSRSEPSEKIIEPAVTQIVSVGTK